MKNKLTSILVICVLITGCGEGFNKNGCLETVLEAYPKATVHKYPGADYRFLVIQDGKLWKVSTMAAGHTGITSRERLPRLSYD